MHVVLRVHERRVCARTASSGSSMHVARVSRVQPHPPADHPDPASLSLCAACVCLAIKPRRGSWPAVDQPLKHPTSTKKKKTCPRAGIIHHPCFRTSVGLARRQAAKDQERLMLGPASKLHRTHTTMIPIRSIDRPTAISRDRVVPPLAPDARVYPGWQVTETTTTTTTVTLPFRTNTASTCAVR